MFSLVGVRRRSLSCSTGKRKHGIRETCINNYDINHDSLDFTSENNDELFLESKLLKKVVHIYYIVGGSFKLISFTRVRDSDEKSLLLAMVA